MLGVDGVVVNCALTLIQVMRGQVRGVLLKLAIVLLELECGVGSARDEPVGEHFPGLAVQQAHVGEGRLAGHCTLGCLEGTTVGRDRRVGEAARVAGVRKRLLLHWGGLDRGWTLRRSQHNVGLRGREMGRVAKGHFGGRVTLSPAIILKHIAHVVNCFCKLVIR